MVPADVFRVIHGCVCPRQQEFVDTRGKGRIAERPAVHKAYCGRERVINVEIRFLADVCVETRSINIYVVAGSASPIVVRAIASLCGRAAVQRCRCSSGAWYTVSGRHRFVIALVGVLRKKSNVVGERNIAVEAGIVGKIFQHSVEVIRVRRARYEVQRSGTVDPTREVVVVLRRSGKS